MSSDLWVISSEKHALLLTHKQVTLYSIAAFDFMQSPEDASLYAQRQGQVHRGLGALTSLEAACERNWEEEQKRLEESCEALHAVVQQSYQRVWQRGEQCYEQMKRNLADLRSQFEQLLLYPNFHLSPEVSELCEELLAVHLFCVIVGDCRLSVAETLMKNSQVLSWDVKRDSKRIWGMKLQKFAQSQAAANRIDAAVKAAEYAKQFGAEGPGFTYEAMQQSEETTNRLQCLFSNNEKNEIEECLAVGLSVNQTGDFDTGLAELQRGRALLAGSTNWELYIQLSNSMAEIHLQRGNYEETVEICRLILNAWTPTAHN